MTGQISMLDMVDRINEQRMQEKLEGWTHPTFKEPAGLVVICRQNLIRDNKNEHHYFRSVLGYHNTVSGMMAHLISVPNEEWPDVPPWGTWYRSNQRWIYPHGSMMQFFTNGETQEPVQIEY